MDNFWRNKFVLVLENMNKQKNPAMFLIKNPEISCFKTTKEIFLVKDKPLSPLLYRMDKDYWFLDTIMLGVVHFKK